MKQINKQLSVKIETAINGIALGLMAFGAIEVKAGNWMGFPMIMLGVGLEFLKYWGRNKKYW